MAHEDWDLFAIVRSCKAATFTTPTTTTQTPLITTTNITRTPSQKEATTFIANQENGPLFSFPTNIVQPRTTGFQELHPLFMNFNPTSTINTTSTSGNSINPNFIFSDFSGSIEQQQHHHTTVLSPTTTYTSIRVPTSGFEIFQQQQQHLEEPQQHQQQQEQKQHNQLHVQVPQTTSMVLPTTQTQTPKSRKRKIQQKKTVSHVTADNLSSDLWAWRKYGQKPIKGSPYPRNYYRCSSCKGCAARKQVERSTTEPNMFILTYTGEHKHPKPAHRNSLAGSTRNKTTTTRLHQTQENGSPSSIDAVSPTQAITTSLSMNMDGEKLEHELGSGSDDEDVLIPNSMGISETVFLSPNTVPGLVLDCSETSSNNTRLNPG
ncbi:hypothetical protein TanjilG_15023 [Lupinus angustifolius]|uniref:WRKY domain-containing protein n=1 Tax=Lupinus angustifolius TaxID=3871 RepID=A0A4P1RAE0_LUPAN|nr:PREDICTED: probable WRKY transcription factor 27 [Lupinus angustifolius]OIW06378.1 hypothetical protein TanjilG_15023 [Lupinus angustifolius]